MKFAGINHYHEHITYILSETGTGTRDQDTTEYSNRRQSVLPPCQTSADA